MRPEFHIVRNDWSRHKGPVLLFSFGLLAILMYGQDDHFAMGTVGGLIAAATFGFAQFCVGKERDRGVLKTLLNLPIRPSRLILAKYTSVYSMTLVLINVPGLYELSLGDFRLVFLANAVVLFAATIFMLPYVISNKPSAGLIPLWAIFIGIAIPDNIRMWALNLITAHATPLAVAALVISPLIAILTSHVFELKSLR